MRFLTELMLSTLILVLWAGGAQSLAQTVYVNACAPGSGDGSQPKPYNALGRAVTEAKPGSTLVVQGGSYTEPLTIPTPNPKNLTITASGGPVMVGGYYVGIQETCVPLLDLTCILGLDFLDPSAIKCASDPPGVRARVYYPAAAPGDAPVACGGPFPLIVYAHGNRFDSERLCDWSHPGPRRDDYLQAGGLLTRLAAAGFIVISVDVSWFPQNDQLKAAIILNTIAYARDENARSGSRFKGAVETSRVSLAGHSRVGAAVVQAAQLLQTDPSFCSPSLHLDGVQIGALALLAPGQDADPVKAPVLVIYGTNDTQQVMDDPLKLYGSANAPKHLVVITGANHYGYTDRICLAPSNESDDESEVGGAAGPEAQRRQQRAAGDYLEAFFSLYLRGDAAKRGYLQGREQSGYPGNPPTCGSPSRRFSDLDSLKVAVSVCSYAL